MEQPILSVRNLSKTYRVRTRSPRSDLLWNALIDSLPRIPFLRSGKRGQSNYTLVHALNDISFEVAPHTVLGIIGRNGAGKSTLLKILTGISEPTSGEVRIWGRVSALLEVGTGFHPELSGRENTYLNGTILGMASKEVSARFDEIVEFSGIASHIDVPIKFYSSGMRMRLAFAVAAHLEPEILIIDEVLAVGDAAFQKKCIDKMRQISQDKGRTILFVSHDLAAVESLTSQCVYLEGGRIKNIDLSRKCIASYLKDVTELSKVSLQERTDREGSGRIKIDNVEITAKDGCATGKTVSFHLAFHTLDKNAQVTELGISVWSPLGVRIISISSSFKNELSHIPGSGVVTCTIPALPLVEGDYVLNCVVYSNLGIEDYITQALQFRVERSDLYGSGKSTNPEWGLIAIDHSWSLNSA